MKDTSLQLQRSPQAANRISVTQSGLEALKELADPNASLFDQTASKRNGKTRFGDTRNSCNSAANLTSNSCMLIGMYNNAKESTQARFNQQLRKQAGHGKRFMIRRIDEEFDGFSGSESPSRIYESHSNLKEAAVNRMSTFGRFGVTSNNSLYSPRNKAQSPTTSQKFGRSHFAQSPRNSTNGRNREATSNRMIELNLERNPFFQPEPLMIDSQLKDMKRKVRGQKYLEKLTKHAAISVDEFTGMLAKDQSTHKLLNFLSAQDGLARTSNPCKAKYSPLLAIKIGDYDLSSIDIDQKSLKQAVVGRFGDTEKQMLHIQSLFRKSKPDPYLRLSAAHTGEHQRTKSFKKNDEFFATEKYRTDKKKLDGQSTTILCNFEQVKDKKLRSSLEFWRQKRQAFEERGSSQLRVKPFTMCNGSRRHSFKKVVSAPRDPLRQDTKIHQSKP